MKPHKFLNFNINTCIILITAALCIAFIRNSFVERKRWRENIKKEVYQELRQEMTTLVKAEVKSEFENYIAQNALTTSDSAIEAHLSEPSKEKNDLIVEAVREAILELAQNEERFARVISNPELDRYIAGRGIDPKLQIGSGMYKNPYSYDELTLAQADTGSDQSSNTQEGRITVQNDEEQVVHGEKQRAESVERVLQQRGSVLLPKGTLQFEPSFVYSNFSSNRINIDGLLLLDVFAIGEISTETVERNIFIETLAFKYGLFNNFQTDLRIPIREEYDRITRTSGTETTNNATGIGDIEFGVSRQIGWEEGWKPDLIAAFNVKPPTGQDPYNREIGLGTGHWAMRGSLIAAKSSDPVVIFGSLNYAYNMARNDIENLGDINPGDSIGYSLGTAIALSYQTAINFSFNHSLTFKTERNDVEVAGSFLNVASFRTGLNWAINERSSVEVGVSLGLTPNAPDVTVEVRFPYTF